MGAARDAPGLEGERGRVQGITLHVRATDRGERPYDGQVLRLKPRPGPPGPDADDPERALRRHGETKRHPQDLSAPLAV
jgi:hypothetical protein